MHQEWWGRTRLRRIAVRARIAAAPQTHLREQMPRAGDHLHVQGIVLRRNREADVLHPVPVAAGDMKGGVVACREDEAERHAAREVDLEGLLPGAGDGEFLLAKLH